MHFNKFYIFLLFLIISCKSNRLLVNESFIKLNNAEIVIGQDAIPTVKFAALELQTYLKKITNNSIPITTEKTKNNKFTFYVGESTYTKEYSVILNPQTEDIKLVSGHDFLILLGKDTKFLSESLGTINDDRNANLEKWDNFTQTHYGHPLLSLYKNYSAKYDIWETDSKGTLNAVYHYLHILGVRWYLPGNLGEVLPESKLIPFPNLKISHKASFPIRNLYFYYNKYFMAKDDFLKWQLRLNLTSGHEVFGHVLGHGMNFVHSRDEFKIQNPTAYALIKGKRNISNYNAGTPCLSSSLTFDNHVKFLKDYFNAFDENAMSIMPGDGFSEICECDVCTRKLVKGKGTNEYMSNYVWEYIERLSLRMAKEKFGKDLTSFAYATYLEPPDIVDKFGENFKLGICYPINGKKDTAEFIYYKELVRNWKNKLSNDSILIWDYYLYTDPKRKYSHTPILFTKYIQNELNFLKDHKSYGKFIEVYSPEPNIQNPNLHLAFDHLNIYLTSRLLWNVNERRETILKEYFNLFYGTAATEIEEIFSYIENTWRENNNESLRQKVLINLRRALKKVKFNSIYYSRIQLLIEYLN